MCERFDSRRTTVALRDLFARQLQQAQGTASLAPTEGVAI
jgi:hypothetical protein